LPLELLLAPYGPVVGLPSIASRLALVLPRHEALPDADHFDAIVLPYGHTDVPVPPT
jgi:hypothetical protein